MTGHGSRRRPGTQLGLLIILFILGSLSANAEQIMVIAAHPDDETLMAAGIIKDAIDRGDTVKVVVVTNGDSSGVAHGHTRQRETVSSLALAGVRPDDVAFLGYPNYRTGGMLRMYNNHPLKTSSAYVSPATGRSSTYGREGLGRADFHTYRSGGPAPYTNAWVLDDLKTLLVRYRPAKIYTHTSADEHPDHRVVYYLVKQSVEELSAQSAQFRPEIFSAVIHPPKNAPYSDQWPASEWRTIPEPDFSLDEVWPLPAFDGSYGVSADMIARFTPDAWLTEPPNLGAAGLSWQNRLSFEVPPEMQITVLSQNLKFKMIEAYATQVGWAGFTYAFGKRDEVFWRVPYSIAWPPPANSSPYFTYGPVAEAYSVPASGQTTFTAKADDPEGQLVTYVWNAQYGSITGTGESVVYTAPGQGGVTDRITVSVQDGVTSALLADFAVHILDGSEPGPAAPELLFSTASDRSGASPLQDAALSGVAYVFTAPDDAVDRVSFFLDDPDMSGTPLQTENSAPYDFAGTASNGAAEPFSFADLVPGAHSITAEVYTVDGQVLVSEAAFTVETAVAQPALPLFYSTRADRSLPLALDGAELSGDIAVFVESLTGLERVSFSLDGTVFHVENAAPYDFNGTADSGTAHLFDTSQLNEGVHEISVTGEFQDGSVARSSAGFIVEIPTSEPPPEPEPEPEGSVDLLVSTEEWRTDAVTLSGALVSGRIYIFATSEDSLQQVTFYLDDTAMTGPPHQVEQLAPFDFSGTTDAGTANAFDTGALIDGTHTVTAAAVFGDGTETVATASFEVSNAEAPAPVPSVFLSLSYSSNRSGAVRLDGATVNGSIYVFLDGDIADVDRVEFYIDDTPASGAPFHTESYAPFDLVSSRNDGTAEPYDSAVLGGGQHTIGALVHWPGGQTEWVEASFAVDIPESTQHKLFISVSPDRSNAVLLERTVLKDDVYIFVGSTDSIEQVRFFLDDPDRSGSPWQVEGWAPFDLAGTGDSGLANPLNTRNLSNSGHNVTAEITTAAGQLELVSATFTVSNYSYATATAEKASLTSEELSYSEPTGEWQLTLTTAEASAPVTLGTSADAVEGADRRDIEAAGDAADSEKLLLQDPGGRWLVEDFRPAAATRASWFVLVESNGGTGAVQWQAAALPADVVLEIARCDVNGQVIGEGLQLMDATGRFIWESEDDIAYLRVLCTRRRETVETLHLKRGWNLVAVSVVPDAEDIRDLFGHTDVTDVLEYDAAQQQYRRAVTVEPLTGYWIKADAEVNLELHGLPAVSGRVDIQPGLNCYGPLADMPVPPGVDAVGWDAVNQKEVRGITVLEKGRAYWLQAETPESVLLK